MKRAIAATSLRFLPLAGSAVILLILSGSGCQKKTPTDQQAGGPQAATPAESQTPGTTPGATTTESQPGKTLVTVNGTAITEGQVERRIQAEYGPQLAKLAAQSPETAAQQEKMLKQSITNKLVIEQLLEEEAQAAKITMTDEEVVAGMTRQLAAQQPTITLEKFKEIVEAQGGDFRAIKEQVARGLKYEKLFESKWGDSVAVTPEEAQKYYGEHPKEFETPEQIRASHILISTQASDPNQDPNQVKAAARQKAETLLKQVKEGGDFAALAKENSTCRSAAEGGDLGLFARGSMVKPFEEAAFALKPGEVSDVVETQFGYHIIKVTEHRDPNTVSFEGARNDITKRLTQQKKNEFVRKYIESLRQKAKIESAAADTTPAPPQITVIPSDPNQK
jgi:peptidyl-prolyl cis-trans isomerase C